ncbi:YdeI/OmpD-associated family protein [Paenibacillus sp. MBLB2552]|uniref:YdeI/OmpD-associated family protein n=1 Tax=Paenibacillus mellifer TaxID=2937794 RepID=A0A9X1Y163_9BACL|nr:YdeI/OmpD-associated family protein [Paenibacillus mellifer]MCK8488581.1 YdeI/OmpD-associated family protein [Paenibacillus mellifer]
MNLELAKKLRFPSDSDLLLVLDAPEGFVEQLGLSSEHTTLDDKLAGKYEFVQMFFQSIRDVAERASQALHAIKPDGLLWLCYPKGGAKAGTDLTRDQGWETVKAAGFDGIALVSVDETWSAMRFRPADKVKLTPGSSRRTASTGEPKAKRQPLQPPEAPEELTVALGHEAGAAKFFAELAPSHQKAYIEWILDAKRAETRQNRIAQTVEKLKQGLKRPSDKA